MNTQTRLLRKTALAAAVTIVVSGVALVGDFAGLETGMSPFVSTAYAGDNGPGGGQKGAMGENRGGEGGRGAGGQGHKGGKSMADVLAEDDGDDDSDRPSWAGVPGGDSVGGGPPAGCQAASDANSDLLIDLADAMYIINYRFRGGPPPADPFPGCDEVVSPEDGVYTCDVPSAACEA